MQDLDRGEDTLGIDQPRADEGKIDPPLDQRVELLGGVHLGQAQHYSRIFFPISAEQIEHDLDKGAARGVADPETAGFAATGPLCRDRGMLRRG